MARFRIRQISVRICLLLTALVVAAVLLLTLLAVTLFTDAVAKNKVEIMQAEMDLMSRGLNEQVELVREVALKVIHNQSVQDCLNGLDGSSGSIQAARPLLATTLGGIAPLNANYIKKTLLISNELEILDALYAVPPYSHYVTQSEDFLRFVDSSASARFSSPLTLPTDGLKNQTINYMCRYLDHDSFEQKGYLLLSIKTNFLFSGIDSAFDQYFDAVCIINRAGQVVYRVGALSPGQEAILAETLLRSGRSMREGGLEGETCYIFNQVLSNYADWVAVGVVSKDRIYREISHMNWMLVSIGIVTVILVIFSGNYLSKRIVRPIVDVVSAMETVEDGDWPAPLVPDTEDELKTLAMGFNSMADTLKRTMEEMLSEQEEKRKAEILALQFQLEMLQYQINPHFIYNTLNAISAMALKNGQEEIRGALQAFSMLLKKTLSNRREFFDLTEELECVEDFLALQRLRFGDIFTFSCALPPAYARVQIPRITLQPLVENALFHGIAPQGGGAVSISFDRAGERLRITVEDDGVGCEADDIAALTRRSKSGAGRFNNIGLSNISERLSLYFGPDCTLRLEPGRKKGTAIYFYLPLGEGEEAADELSRIAGG